MPIELYSKFLLEGRATALSNKYTNERFEGADGRDLAWRVMGSCELRILIHFRDIDASIANDLTLVVVQPTLPEANLAHLIVGLDFMQRCGWLPALMDFAPQGLVEEKIANSRHRVSSITSFTLSKIQSTFPELDISDVEIIDPPNFLPPPGPSGGSIPLAPHTIEFGNMDYLPSEEEFVPPLPQELEQRTKLDNLATGLHQLPMYLQTKVTSRVLHSPFCASAERSVPADFHFTIQTNVNASASPQQVYRFPSPADTAAIDEVLSKSSHSWKQLVPQPGQSPPAVYGYIFMVHVDGKPPRPVVNCIAGNVVAAQFPSACDDASDILLSLADPNKPYLNSVDLTKAYPQIGFSDPSLIYTIRHRNKYYAPLRLPMGATFSPYVLDRAMQSWFGSLLVRSWRKFADNMYSASSTQEQAVEAFLELFALCERFSVVINHKGLLIGATTIPCLGYYVGAFPNAHGYRLKELKSILWLAPDRFKTLADVQSFLHTARFHGNQCATILSSLTPFKSLLEGQSQDSKVLAKTKLIPQQIAALTKAAGEVIYICTQQLTLAIPKPGHHVIITCDASTEFHAAICWQFPPHQVGLPIEQLTLEPFQVTHGTFSAAEKAYHIHEKELHAAQRAIVKAYPFLKGMAKPVTVLTDSSTVVSKTRPFAASPQAHARLTRVVLFFHSIGVVVHHTPGIANVADSISRTPINELLLVDNPVVQPWLTPTATQTEATVLPTEILAHTAVIPPPAPLTAFAVKATLTRQGVQQATVLTNPLQLQSTDIFVAPGLTSLNQHQGLGELKPRKRFRNLLPSQDTSLDFAHALLKATDPSKPLRPGEWRLNGLRHRRVGNRDLVVIPEEATELKHYLMALNHHAGLAHPSAVILAEIISYKFTWDGMKQDTANYVAQCAVCATSTDYKQPVQLGTFRAALGPNQVLGMDFCDMKITAHTGETHVLVLADMYSHRCRFAATHECTAQFVVEQIIAFANSGPYWHTLVSDQGSQFASDKVRKTCELLKANHYLTMANIEFTRGFLETTVRTFKNVLRKILAGGRFNFRSYPSLLEPTATVINNLPSIALRGHSPNHVTFGESRLPGALVATNISDSPQEVPVAFDVSDWCELWGFHVTQARLAVEAHRFPNGIAMKNKPRRLLSDFSPGDLVFRATENLETSLSPRWSDLSEVIQATGERTFRIKSLVSGVESERHVALLRRLPGVAEGSLLTSWDFVLWNALVTHKVSYIGNLRFSTVKGKKVLYCTMIDIAGNSLPKPVHELMPLFPRLFQGMLGTDLMTSKEIERELRTQLTPHVAVQDTLDL